MGASRRGDSRGGDDAGATKTSSGGGSGTMQRPSATRGSDQTAGSGVSNYRSAGRATPFDQRDMKKGPYKGSARQWEEMTSDRARMSEMAIRMDENNREIEMQKLEIRRLREQVRMLLRRGSLGAGQDPMNDLPPVADIPTRASPDRSQLKSREFSPDLPGAQGSPTSPSP